MMNFHTVTKQNTTKHLTCSSNIALLLFLDLINYFHNSKVPDEHFYATLVTAQVLYKTRKVGFDLHRIAVVQNSRLEIHWATIPGRYCNIRISPQHFITESKLKIRSMWLIPMFSKHWVSTRVLIIIRKALDKYVLVFQQHFTVLLPIQRLGWWRQQVKSLPWIFYMLLCIPS